MMFLMVPLYFYWLFYGCWALVHAMPELNYSAQHVLELAGFKETDRLIVKAIKDSSDTCYYFIKPINSRIGPSTKLMLPSSFHFIPILTHF